MRCGFSIAIAICWLGLGAFAQQKEPDKALMQQIAEAWQTLDPAKAAPFYAQEPDHVFFDVAPLKYRGWKEYAEGFTKTLGTYASAQFALEDAQTRRRGNIAWGTAIIRGTFVKKDGAKETFDARWTLIWEKRGNNWLVLHEHASFPQPPEPESK